MKLDAAMCYRAVLARDARFDGRFFTCVKTTGIYCRPICPARPPKLEHCQFALSAAAAQEWGFRPCLRCRPESSPDLDAWRGTEATVSRALKLIESGALDDGDVESLANRLGIGERHLRRLFREHLGAAPVTVAQTRRVLLAKQLIHQTDLSMIQIALASGFRSVRRFNETFQQLYQRPPGDLRHRAKANSSSSPEISLLLPYRSPFDWESMLSFLQFRAISGLEVVTNGTYNRVIELDGANGSISISHAEQKSALRVIVRFPRLQSLPNIVARIRRMFDLSADPGAIARVLSADRVLRPLISAKPGLRVPVGWDPFEIAVRAVLGQQITVTGARLLGCKMVSAIGHSIDETSAVPGLTHAFPRPERFESSSLAALGMPKSRATSLAKLAAAVSKDPHLFDPRRDLDELIANLCELPGIGPWTANYIAMRGLGESNAFLAADIGVQRKLELLTGRTRSANEILRLAEAWQPWRAYAVLHLWLSDTKPAKKTRFQPIKESRHAIAT